MNLCRQYISVSIVNNRSSSPNTLRIEPLSVRRFWGFCDGIWEVRERGVSPGERTASGNNASILLPKSFADALRLIMALRKKIVLTRPWDTVITW